MLFGPVLAGLVFLSLFIKDWRNQEIKKAKEAEKKKSEEQRRGDRGRRAYDNQKESS